MPEAFFRTALYPGPAAAVSRPVQRGPADRSAERKTLSLNSELFEQWLLSTAKVKYREIPYTNLIAITYKEVEEKASMITRLSDAGKANARVRVSAEQCCDHQRFAQRRAVCRREPK